MNHLTTILTVTSLFENIQPTKVPEVVEQVTKAVTVPFVVQVFEWITIGSLVLVSLVTLYLREERRPDSFAYRLTIRHRKKALFGKTVGTTPLIDRLTTLNALLYNKGYLYMDNETLKALRTDTANTIEKLLYILEKDGKHEKKATLDYFDIALSHEQYLLQETNAFLKNSRMNNNPTTIQSSLNLIKDGVEKAIEGYQNIRSKAIEDELQLYREVKENINNR